MPKPFMKFFFSFVRQRMLANTFSFLPVQLEDRTPKSWYMISEYNLARYLRSAESPNERVKRLAGTVREAIDSKQLAIEQAICVRSDDKIVDVMGRFNGQPLLVLDDHEHLVGILTAADVP